MENLKELLSDQCKTIIRSHENKDEVIDAFDLKIKLFKNIKKDPKEPKFRNFKITNETLKSKVLNVKGTLDLLECIGYSKTADDLYTYLPESIEPIDQAIEAFEAAIISIYTKSYEKKEIKGNSVILLVYDLSNGMARSYSPALLGKVIEGIWHTSILVHGVEFYYGGGIHESAPRKSPYGHPVKELYIGDTEMSVEMVRDYLRELGSKFNTKSYHVLNNNCNHCANEIAFFLTGNNVPEAILNQHKELVNTPIGSMILPMLEKMNEDNSQSFPNMFERR
jgi:hypothetical protein